MLPRTSSSRQSQGRSAVRRCGAERSLGGSQGHRAGDAEPRRREAWRGRPALALAALVAVAVGGAGCERPQRFNGEVVRPPVEAPPLVGTNWDGEPFEFSRHRGKVGILFFGYTYCPDVCPLTLAKMKQLVARLGDRADEVAVVFVSVDPQRDTVEKLSQYVPNFDQRFYGVHLDELETTAHAFDVTVQYGQPEDGPGTDSYYYVDHTGDFFLYDRQGWLRVRFRANATVDQMLPDIETLLAS